jgi:hypothetical protein
MDELCDLLPPAGEPPLHVHGALATPRQTLSSLLRTQVPKAWCHHSAPLALERPGCGRVSLRHPLLGQGLVGWLDQDGPRFGARLGVVHTLGA